MDDTHSPLKLIAIFGGLIESSALAILPFLEGDDRTHYTWFLVGFPPFLALMFFLTLNFNHQTLYTPQEKADAEHGPSGPAAAEVSQAARHVQRMLHAMRQNPPIAIAGGFITTWDIRFIEMDSKNIEHQVLELGDSLVADLKLSDRPNRWVIVVSESALDLRVRTLIGGQLREQLKDVDCALGFMDLDQLNLLPMH